MMGVYVSSRVLASTACGGKPIRGPYFNVNLNGFCVC